VPSGGLLVPTVGVGGHCLPKDGILLWWRALEAREDTARSLILQARKVNDESPAKTIELAERAFGPLAGRSVALLGAAYRFNSEDTRNSPTLSLARLLITRGAKVRIHDPYVYPTDQNLLKTGLDPAFSRDLAEVVQDAEVVFLCTGHREYLERQDEILAGAKRLVGVVDACNLWRAETLTGRGIGYTGIGRGRRAPDASLVASVTEGFRSVETGVANEVQALVQFLNRRYAADGFNEVKFSDVQKIAGTCVTGCRIVAPGPITWRPAANALVSSMTAVAAHEAA
jgi:hypothetical protein